MRKFWFGLLIILAAVFSFSLVGAQEEKSNTEFSAPEIAPLPNTVNCFDYYKFGSVKAEISSPLSSTVPGVPLTFQVNVRNENDYPVVDAAVYVKIYRTETDGVKAHNNGHNLVDQFFAKEDIDIDAGQSTEFDFNWKVPLYAQPGEYQIYTYVVSAKKFNLLGLSFTDDVKGNRFFFNVDTPNGKAVSFDKSNVLVNEKPYYFSAAVPTFAKDESITIKAELVNDASFSQEVPVRWTAFAWDGLQKENIVDEKNEVVQIAAGQKKTVEYKIEDRQESVYYVVVEAAYHDAKSLLNMRVARKDVDKVRINFPALTSFPIKKNQPVTMFSCLHGAGTADMVSNNKLVLSLLDPRFKAAPVYSYTYTGDITGDVMAVKSDFKSEENYNQLLLKAELFHNEQLVDSALMKYDCQDIDPSKCLSGEEDMISAKIMSSNILKFVIFGIILFLGLMYIIYRSNKRFLIMIILSVGALLAAQSADAKDIVWESGVIGDNLKYRALEVDNYDELVKGLDNFNVNVHYAAQVINHSQGGAVVSDKGKVAVGDELEFKVITTNTDIEWTGTGYMSDTPSGYWHEGAEKPRGWVGLGYGGRCKTGTPCYDFTHSPGFNVCTPNPDSAYPCCRVDLYPDCGCAPEDIVAERNNGSTIHVSLSVDPYEVDINHSGSADLECDGNRCKVMSEGTIKTTVSYSSTYGKFYWQAGAPKVCHHDPYYPVNNPRDALKIKGSQEYVLEIPEQEIELNLTTSDSANECPVAPSISGPTVGKLGELELFDLKTTDAEKDKVYFGIDWDDNGTVDQLSPGSGYINSGDTQTVSYTWTTLGEKKFKVKAGDEKSGLCSFWSTHTIQIQNAPSPPPDCTMPVVDLSANKSSVEEDGNLTLAWTVTGGSANYCTAWSSGSYNESGQWDSTVGNNYTGVGSSKILTDLGPVGVHTYSMKCGNSAVVGCETLDTVSVEIDATPEPEDECGNGIVEGGEKCDLGSGPGIQNGECPSTCSSTCQLNNCKEKEKYQEVIP